MKTINKLAKNDNSNPFSPGNWSLSEATFGKGLRTTVNTGAGAMPAGRLVVLEVVISVHGCS
jgi:hypothetical protein